MGRRLPRWQKVLADKTWTQETEKAAGWLLMGKAEARSPGEGRGGLGLCQPREQSAVLVCLVMSGEVGAWAPDVGRALSPFVSPRLCSCHWDVPPRPQLHPEPRGRLLLRVRGGPRDWPCVSGLGRPCLSSVP